MLYNVYLNCTIIATFFDACSAQKFVKAENDKVQADMLYVEQMDALIDNYGYPFDRKDIPVIWPHRFAAEVELCKILVAYEAPRVNWMLSDGRKVTSDYNGNNVVDA
jgi:hypothetical protein